MAAQALPWITPEQYLEMDREAETPSEYWDGHIVPIEGATANHSRIVINLSRELSFSFKKRPCEVLAQGVKLRVDLRGPYTVPDLVIACPPELADKSNDVLLNPLIVIEVLSHSTERRDRGHKFLQSRSIPSLQEYVLVSQHEPRVEVFRRQAGDAWLHTVSSGLDASVILSSADVTVALAEIYDKVQLTVAEGSDEAS